MSRQPGRLLSGLLEGLVGGLKIAPIADMDADASIFEAVRSSAPEIAGKGIANPTGLLLAAAMMLGRVKLTEKTTCQLRTPDFTPILTR